MRLGIFGGTFDPPHNGHLILAGEALKQFELAHVHWVLTPDPPHKLGQRITRLIHRLDMVKAGINGSPNFSLSLVDVERPSPHFAIDTIKIMGKKYPGVELIYIIGADSLENLPQWHRPEELVGACQTLAVMLRAGTFIDMDHLEKQIKGIKAKVKFFDTPTIEISASQIRKRIRNKKAFRKYVTLPVFEIIVDRGLYLSVRN
jgi:nicotinate-nucleotide adenylyltransferase